MNVPYGCPSLTEYPIFILTFAAFAGPARNAKPAARGTIIVFKKLHYFLSLNHQAPTLSRLAPEPNSTQKAALRIFS